MPNRQTEYLLSSVQVFVLIQEGYYLAILVRFVHQRNALSVSYKPRPFQNTVYLKNVRYFKDVFLKMKDCIDQACENIIYDTLGLVRNRIFSVQGKVLSIASETFSKELRIRRSHFVSRF